MFINLLKNPLDLIFLLVALVIAITFHELAHALTAVFLGDITPKLEGRVSLNPLRHLDPVGSLFLLIAGFGWGKPVPFNPNFVKHGRWGVALIGASGPLTNILVAFIFILALKTGSVPFIFAELFIVIILINILLAVFNLLPIPPLDGSKILQAVLPESKQEVVLRIEREGPIILLILIFADRILGLGILSSIINPIFNFVLKILSS